MIPLFIQSVRPFTVLPPRANTFKENEKVSIYAGPLKSGKVPYPYDYNYMNLFCDLKDEPASKPSAIAKLFGSAEQKTPIEVEIGKDIDNKQLCTVKYNADQHQKLIQLIDDEYRIYYSIDNLLIVDELQTNESLTYLGGVPIGFKDNNGKHYLYNHLEFNIELSPFVNDKASIVGFESGVLLSSEGSESVENLTATNFTFSIHFTTTKKAYVDRWDKINFGVKSKIHWMSIFSTLAIIIAQSIVFGALLLRTVKFDFIRYKKMFEDEDDPLEESGWKLIHGDVFRRPNDVDKLSQLLAGGVTLFIAVGLLLLLATIGFFDYVGNISMAMAFIYCFVFSSPIGGIISGLFFHTIGTKTWKNNMIMCSLTVVLPVFVVHGAINIVFLDSSITMSLFSFLAIYGFYGGLSIFLFIVGHIIGLRVHQIEFPARVNQLPRQIPIQPAYLNSNITMSISGLIIFLSFAFQAHTLLDAIWTSTTPYRLFWISFLVFCAMIITACETTVLVVYLHLAHEDYNWWWPAARTAFVSGVFFFVYSLVYLLNFYQPPTLLAIFVYIGVCALIGYFIALINGATGFLASIIFVIKLFSELKME